MTMQHESSDGECRRKTCEIRQTGQIEREERSTRTEQPGERDRRGCEERYGTTMEKCLLGRRI